MNHSETVLVEREFLVHAALAVGGCLTGGRRMECTRVLMKAMKRDEGD